MDHAWGLVLKNRRSEVWIPEYLLYGASRAYFNNFKTREVYAYETLNPTTMSAFPRISTTSVGQNKNAPRVWIEGRYLLKAEFVPAKNMKVEFASREIRITLAQDGPRRVSSKKNKEIPSFSYQG